MPLYIEVKTTVKGKNETFFMSENENRDGKNYELHRVYRINKAGVGKVVVYTLKDLESFVFETGQYAVRRRTTE